MSWIIKESNLHGATILYNTHIFGVFDEKSTHLHYLTEEEKCGWQGDIQDLEKYQKTKEVNHTYKMLAIVDH